MILITLRELYLSANGDKWEVAEDDDKRLFIRHTPNAASGGKQSIVTLASFLQPDHAGPQQHALNKLIETGQLVIWPNTPRQYFA